MVKPMKTLYSFLLAAVLLPAALFGAASVGSPKLIHLPDNGVALPILREALDSGKGSYLIQLDTSEVDTGYINIDVLDGQIYSITDTVGLASFTCKDSTGTDTIAIVLKWQANPRPDGKGVWRNIDSLELKDLAASGAAGQGVYRDTNKVVVNTGGYSLFRFFLKNKLATNANRKATCKDAVLIRRKRAAYR
jgi:hypothetical protein